MNFPLLKTFEVSNIISSFLEKKFDDYKKQYGSWDEENSFNTEYGYQTDNLLKWDDKEFNIFTKENLLQVVSSQLNIDKTKISFHWIHFLDYVNGGSMNQHKHWHNEDFVMFIYLKDCKRGKTIFYLNDYSDQFKERTQVGITPKKNTAAIFSSLLLHKGEKTTENKRIFVMGIRVNI
jgi:hypothetical protein